MVQSDGDALERSVIQVCWPGECSLCFYVFVVLIHYQDNLRRRFSNASRWYSTLLDAVQVRVQDVLEDSRPDVLLSQVERETLTPLPSSSPVLSPASSPTVDGFQEATKSPSIPSCPSSPALSHPDHLLSHSDTPFPPTSSPPSCRTSLPPPSSPTSEHHTGHEEPDPPNRTRPSAYLRRKCAMCFGGDRTHDETSM